MKNIKNKYILYVCCLLLFCSCCKKNNAIKKTDKYYINGGVKQIEKENFVDYKNIYPYNLWGNIVVQDAKVASNIAYIIIKEHFGKKYVKSNNEFRIYSVNNVAWAIFDKNGENLLLLIQKKNCKVLYIHKS